MYMYIPDLDILPFLRSSRDKNLLGSTAYGRSDSLNSSSGGG